MKRLLVTGASGLLGLNLIMQASDRYEIMGVLRHERLANEQKPLFQPIYADLAEEARSGKMRRWMDQWQPDGIINCAAMTDVDHCEAYPDEAALINACVPGVLAREAFCRNLPMLHISTDAVFDGRQGDYSEQDEPNPLNVYARTKLDGEQEVAKAHPGAIIARVNFYGWSWQGSRSLAEWFYNNLSREMPVRGFTNLMFCPLLVNPMVEILLRMMALRLSGVYHVVSSECISKFAFGERLARRFGFNEKLISPYSFQTGDLKAPRSRRLTLRSEKLSKALGQALPGQDEALDEFYQLHRQGYPETLRSMFERSKTFS